MPVKLVKAILQPCFFETKRFAKFIKEFLKFVMTSLQIHQDEFLIFPKRIHPFPPVYGDTTPKNDREWYSIHYPM